MTKQKEINFKQLEGKTVGEALKIEKQLPKLPVGFKMKYKPVKIITAEQLLDEIK